MKSNNKTTITLFFLLFAGVVYADEVDAANEADTDNDADIEIMKTVLPKNVITIDGGQMAFFLLLTGLIYTHDSPFYAFGTAAQYERQITEKASAAVRFEYSIIDSSDTYSKWRMQTFSAEGHGRFYPMQNNFFLDGTLGYAAVLCDFSTPENEIKPIAHYFKLGGKLGWRIDFKKPSGFVLEPALGLNIAIGTKIKTGDEKDFPILGGLLNMIHDYLAQWVLAGGIRFSLGLGYRF